jgi:transcriptional regulator with XRE-family HTH domain
MHLADYMARNDLTDEEVAEAIGRSRVSVSRYRRGIMRPDWDVIQAIRKFTKNRVNEDDWRELAAERAA